MARGRMVNNSISLSIKFHQLPDDTCRLLATWIISHLDKNGVFYGEANTVRSLVFPFRADVAFETVETYLQAMEKVGLIIRFEANGLLWQCWPTFDENQVGLRPERESSNFPSPPADTPPEDNPPPVNTPPPDDSSIPQASTPPPVDTPPEDTPPVKDSPPLPESIPQPADIVPQTAGIMPEPCRIDAGTMPEAIPPKEKVKFKGESKDIFHGGDLKSSRAPAKARASPSPPLIIPAFKVWVDSGLSRGLDKDFISELDRVVGRDPPALTLFGKICVAGRRKGWRKNNIDWAIDWFKRGEIPGQDRKNGGRNAANCNGNSHTAAAVGVGEWTADELREAGLSEQEIERMVPRQLVGS